jgi:hypothetical protein
MSDITKYVKEKLLEMFESSSTYEVDGKGYVFRPEHNLIPGITMGQFKDDLCKGSGDELRKKFCAIHSSSALAVSTFARWKRNPHTLNLCGVHGFDRICFEKKCNTGLGGTPPNLDLLLEGENHIIGVESKFMEYLTPKKPAFSASYERNRLAHAEENGGNFLKKCAKANP